MLLSQFFEIDNYKNLSGCKFNSIEILNFIVGDNIGWSNTMDLFEYLLNKNKFAE